MNDRKLIDEICSDCTKEYCTLKEIVLHGGGPSDRNAIQIKAVEKLKYIWSDQQHHDIGWKDAWDKYIADGYAAKYADIYKEGISFMDAWFELNCYRIRKELNEKPHN